MILGITKGTFVEILAEILLIVFIALLSFGLGSIYARERAAISAAKQKSGVYKVGKNWEKDDKVFYELEELTTSAGPTGKHTDFRDCYSREVRIPENSLINLVNQNEAMPDTTANSTDKDCYLTVVPYQ